MASDSSETLARTPLYDLHVALGARMVGFAGYAMPVQYAAGIIAEHQHVRVAAGLFDVSHMGQGRLSGANAVGRLESLVPGDLTALGAGRMRYTQLLDPDGKILDDLIVTRLSQGDDNVFLVVNAGTKTQDFDHIAAHLPDLRLERLEDRALLALQGPQAAFVLERYIQGVAQLAFMAFASFDVNGVEWFVTRSGYTGEDGFEISLPARQATGFAETLLGEPEVKPIGLGARDSLRLEAGLCLYGHDIDTTTDPVEAGLLWSISKRRRADGGFPGAATVQRAIAQGPSRRRVGLAIEGRAPAREGAAIVTPQGETIGSVTSGGFAPSLGRPIAMGYVAASHAEPGTSVNLIVREKPLAARVTPMPFVAHRYHRGS